MNLLTDAEIRVLRKAGFTLREITTQQRKFHNLLRVSPWIAEDLTKREWVGLTDEEIFMNCPNWLSQEQCKVWIQQIEAKLKEKNT